MTNKQTVPEQAYGNQAQLTLATWCLLKYREAISLSYEKEDDITILQKNNHKLFIQVKSGKKNPLLDSSPELWKTILNWTRQCTTGNSEQFIILVTQDHEYGEFCKKIFEFQKNNNFESLYKSLTGFYFHGTKNKKIKKDIESYLYAKNNLQHIFLQMQIITTQDIHTHKSIENELELYHEQKAIIGQLKDSLIGWVEEEIEKQSISNPKSITICNIAFSKYHANLRTTLLERLKFNLTPPSITSSQKESLMSNTFIRQLDAIKLDIKVKEEAAIDFLTAEKYFEDMIYDGVIVDDEVQEERFNLKSFWSDSMIKPSIHKDEQRGKEIYSACMTYRSSPLYTKAQKVELLRGTYHMLAEEVEVWWHPDFESMNEE